MLADTKNAELYEEWLSFINDAEAKDAFRYLIGLASGLSAYTCHPQRKGAVRDFRFIAASGEQPFSFIVNRAWLLFYFRIPGIRTGSVSFERLRSEFPTAEANSRAEWTIRLHRITDVQRLALLVGMV